MKIQSTPQQHSVQFQFCENSISLMTFFANNTIEFFLLFSQVNLTIYILTKRINWIKFNNIIVIYHERYNKMQQWLYQNVSQLLFGIESMWQQSGACYFKKRFTMMGFFNRGWIHQSWNSFHDWQMMERERHVLCCNKMKLIGYSSVMGDENKSLLVITF